MVLVVRTVWVVRIVCVVVAVAGTVCWIVLVTVMVVRAVCVWPTVFVTVAVAVAVTRTVCDVTTVVVLVNKVVLVTATTEVTVTVTDPAGGAVIVGEVPAGDDDETAPLPHEPKADWQLPKQWSDVLPQNP